MQSRRIFTSVVALAALWICLTALLPLRGSEASIRRQFLEKYPIGTGIVDYRKAEELSGLNILNEWDRPSDGPIAPGRDSLRGRRVIMVSLGHYQGLPFRVDVVAYVGFTDARLVDCVIDKQYDAL